MNHPLRDGHPDDSGMGYVPAAHNGIEGDLLSEGIRPVPMGEVSKKHVKAVEDKALAAMTRDAVRSGTVPLADKTPLPTLKPITTQVRKLELPESMNREDRNTASRLAFEHDQCLEHLYAHREKVVLFASMLAAASEKGEKFTLENRVLELATDICLTMGERLSLMQIERGDPPIEIDEEGGEPS